jgi:NAD(P)-dependent dehydrogenase (short-subunit alcohol dehydrogenase family)
MSHRSAVTQGGAEAVKSRLAMGEWVPPSEIADLIVYLSSGRHRHLSGATIDINGATNIR